MTIINHFQKINLASIQSGLFSAIILLVPPKIHTFVIWGKRKATASVLDTLMN